MEAKTDVVTVEKREIINNVMCLLTDPDRTPLGAPIYLPQNASPQQLQQIVNKLLNNEEKLPYAFYISNEELLVPLGTYLQKNKVIAYSLPTSSYFSDSSCESVFSNYFWSWGSCTNCCLQS